MLYWVGKRPLEYAKGFPARLAEVFDPLKTGTAHEPPIFRDLEKDWQNLLFHGDNREVLATLLENGFRGKVDLIYIDPPFDSGANYVRKAELRGVKTDKLEGADYTPMEQTMYFDIWKNDSYLQWMYERLQLLKELLSENGSIFLHVDWHKEAHLKLLLDEIFGENNLRNEIIWHYHDKFATGGKSLDKNHDTIYHYSKAPDFTGNEVRIDKEEKTRRALRKKVDGKTINILDDGGNKVYGEFTDKRIDDVWEIGRTISKNEYVDYPTQKKEDLLERVLQYGSSEGDVIADFFSGSGTTQAVAQKLGRRWIGCDINKGAIQTAGKRLQKVVNERLKGKERPKHPSFAVYQVNDYDLQILRTEAVELAVEHIGIARRKTEPFFDGLLGKELVKIIDLNHPLTLLDLQLVEDELKKRPDEERNIVLVCLGKELTSDAWIEVWNKKHPVNKMRTIELRTDKKYGKFFTHQPDIAKVEIERKGGKAIIDIQSFISPTIIERLNDGGLFKVKIPDHRSMIDTVLIDTAYDGKTFCVAFADVPEKKSDFVKGHYELDIPKTKTTIAVKIIDMLGEEIPVTKQI